MLNITKDDEGKYLIDSKGAVYKIVQFINAPVVRIINMETTEPMIIRLNSLQASDYKKLVPET